MGKLTVLLAAVLVAGLGFLGGVLVQKHHGSATNTTALGGRAGAPALRGRTGGGGFGGATAGAGSGSAAPSTASGSTDTGATPVVIGTIVSVDGNTVVVKNFGGKLVTVTLSADTAVTRAATASDLHAGQTVSVRGSTGSAGTVSATAIGAQ